VEQDKMEHIKNIKKLLEKAEKEIVCLEGLLKKDKKTRTKSSQAPKNRSIKKRRERVASVREIREAIEYKVLIHGNTRGYYEEKIKEAKNKGYKNESCSCGTVFLACDHFVRCDDETCPFKEGKSLLDHISGDSKKE
jgi:hypothetical protein